MSVKLHQQLRPAYKHNSGVINRPIVPFKKTRFVIDNDVTRPATATAPGVKSRVPLGVELMRKIDEDSYGAKVQLSEKALDKLFNVREDDPTDEIYIDRKRELEAEGRSPQEIENIIGRQRQITKRVNLADSSLAVKDKIELLERAVKSGLDNTREGLSAIVGQTSLLLGDGSFIDRMTGEDITRLKEVLRGIDMPKDYRRAGFNHRIYNKPQYKDELGLVNLFIMTHLEPPRTLESPLLGVPTMEGVMYLPKISNYISYLSSAERGRKPEKYIDLEERRFLSRAEAMQLANEGVDGGVLNGEPRPPGGWDAQIPPSWALPKPVGQRGRKRGEVVVVGDEEKGESKNDPPVASAVGENTRQRGRPRGKKGKKGRKSALKGNGYKRNLFGGADNPQDGDPPGLDELIQPPPAIQIPAPIQIPPAPIQIPANQNQGGVQFVGINVPQNIDDNIMMATTARVDRRGQVPGIKGGRKRR